MKSVIQNLDQDSILMLYVSEELCSEDRVAVEAQLTADPALRAQADRLRATLGLVEESLAAADAAAPPVMDPRVAQRHVARLLHDFHVRREENPVSFTGPRIVRALRFPWWAYPTAAAAAVLLAFIAWWGNTPVRQEAGIVYQAPPVPPYLQSAQTDPDPDTVADEVESSFHTPHESLRSAEHELLALSEASQDVDETIQQVNQ